MDRREHRVRLDEFVLVTQDYHVYNLNLQLKMADTPSCKAWRGKYPVVLDPVSDDMFWKARVKYEQREGEDGQVR